MTRGSLRRRLLVILLLATASVWVAVAWSSYRDTHRELSLLFDSHLAEQANRLLAEHQASLLQDPETLGRLASPHLQRSTNPPPGRFANREQDGKRWRIYTLRDPITGHQVEVSEEYQGREQLAAAAAQRIALPLVIGLPLLAGVIWLGVSQALKPLNRLAREVRTRGPAQLTPVDESRVPTEVQPLASAINALLDRLERALDSERSFTTDAAHELRTPLAALKTQVQVAMRAQGEAREAVLPKVLEGVLRATHILEQLLALARLEPQQGTQPPDRVDVRRLVADLLVELYPESSRRNIDLGLGESAGSTLVRGYTAAIRLLARNVIDNALRYTPDGGRVEVRVVAEVESVVLEVDDSGPGIPEAERARVFERFYRSELTTASGCGLGLSIVQRVAQLHQAGIELDRSPFGGLRMRITFPRGMTDSISDPLEAGGERQLPALDQG